MLLENIKMVIQLLRAFFYGLEQQRKKKKKENTSFSIFTPSHVFFSLNLICE